MPETVTIALVGAGRTGTTFLREILQYNYVRVIGVTDLDESAPGLALAREHGLYTSADPMELIGIGEQIDILVDLSGDLGLKRQIKDFFERTGNVHTIIMHDLVARLCISLCTRQSRLLPTLHPEVDGVGF